MANIQHVRSFNGTSDWIRLTSTDFTTAFGALTFLAIVKSNIAVDAGFTEILAISGGSGGQFGFFHQDSVSVDPGIGCYFDSPGVGFEEPSFLTPAMGWCLVGFTKADGTGVTPRLHRYRYDTTTWTHTDLGGTIDEGPAPAGTPNMYIGTWNTSIEFFNGEIAVVGGWMGTALSDGNIETLETDIAAWDALTPTGLWLLNQTSTSETLLDRIGNGDQAAINGTSVVSPTGLTFDVGAAPAAPTIRTVRSNLWW